MMGIRSRLDEAHVGLKAIGSGSAEGARRFVEETGFPGRLYLSRDLAAYRAFRLERGIWKTLSLASVARALEALFEGFRQGRTDGDPWQQGGVFVLGPRDVLLYQYKSAFAGDLPDPDEVLEAALR
ncbi:MAG TPA: peroxiredoxin-like family protein [Deltaproteobacteria bacterium]|nr:peroxiredoxin-like family protein [Deltaproteobacteria bacterium]HPP80496.1 peroxiredoxin-like family protein [Deltaproteobacteria bacterium]